MAQKYENAKGHLIIKMSYEEAKNKCHFGFADFIVCDDCNEDIIPQNNIFYVAALNSILCGDCMRTYCTSIRYTDKLSIFYEKQNYNNIARKLGLAEIN